MIPPVNVPKGFNMTNGAAPTGPPGPPPHVQVMGMIMATLPSRVLAAVAQLGIPDALGSEALTPMEVAGKLDAYEPWVRRLMRATASLGVFRADPDGRFANTPLGDALRSDTPNSVRALGVLVNQPFHFMGWTQLADGVRTGQVPFERVHGQTFFDHLCDTPADNATFAAWMTQTSNAANSAILAAYDFTQAHTVMDVGGGQGALLAAVLKHAPQAHGILFDTPEVVGATTPLDNDGLRSRSRVVGGNFFESVPGGADLLMLKTVLHDWDDDDCSAILRRCRESVGVDGSAKLLIIESVLPDECLPHPGFMMDINMMVLNHGGRERTRSEYEALLSGAGFQLQQIFPTQSPMSIVEAVAV